MKTDIANPENYFNPQGCFLCVYCVLQLGEDGKSRDNVCQLKNRVIKDNIHFPNNCKHIKRY